MPDKSKIEAFLHLASRLVLGDEGVIYHHVALAGDVGNRLAGPWGPFLAYDQSPSGLTLLLVLPAASVHGRQAQMNCVTPGAVHELPAD